MECTHRWQQERLARSKVRERSVSRVRLVEHGVLYVFRGDAFNYLRCWNLYAVPMLFEAKENDRDFSLSSLLPFASYLGDAFVSLFYRPGLFDLSQDEQVEDRERKRLYILYAFSRLKIFLEMLIVCNSRETERENYIFDIKLYSINVF